MDKEEVLSQFILPERLERLDQVLESRTRSLTVVLDRVKNHHNISAVIRSADAFGLAGIHLIGDSFNFSNGISLGTERWMELKAHPSPSETIEHLKSEGFSLVVLQPEDFEVPENKSQPIPVSSLPFEDKLALIFGNEKHGVDPLFVEAADIYAFIPMCGFVESLNISVACAITLYSSLLPKAAPVRRTAALQENERKELRETWLKRDVRNSDIILKEIEMRTKFEE
jgi:tRNA (guanosine-2'-O-)-methyltransferase